MQKTEEQLAELTAKLTRYELWSELLDKFEVFYKSVEKSHYHLFCRACKPMSLSVILNIKKDGHTFGCSCGYSSNDFSIWDLISLSSKENPCTAEVIAFANELVMRKELQQKKRKDAAELRMKKYGCYPISGARVVPAKKKTPTIKPKRVRPSKPVRSK